MKRSTDRFALGLIFLILSVFVMGAGVYADESNPFRNIGFEQSSIKAGEPLSCSIELSAEYSALYVEIEISLLNPKTGEPEMSKRKGAGIDFSASPTQSIAFSDTSNMPSGTWEITSIKYSEVVDRVPESSELKTVAFDNTADDKNVKVTGGGGWPSIKDAKISKTEIKPIEYVTFSITCTDGMEDTSNRGIKSATLKYLLRQSKTSIVEKTADAPKIEKISDTDYKITWRISARGVPVNTTIILQYLEVANHKDRTVKIDNSDEGNLYLKSVRVVEKYSDEASDPEDESSDSSSNPKETSEDSSSNNTKDNSSNNSTNNTSNNTSNNSSSGNSSSGSTTHAAETMAAVAFNKNTACAGGTDSGQSISYLTGSVKSDDPLLGTEFYILRARQAKVTKTSITIKWEAVTKPVKAVEYIVLGAPCGKKKKFVQLATTTGTTYTQKKLKKGTYYKYLVMAVDKSGRIITTSASVIVATSGGNYGNYSAVKLTSKKNLSLQVGKKSPIKASAVNKSALKIKPYRRLTYEWTEPEVISVSKKGKIKGLKQGTAYVYVFTQNGFYKRIKVKVS